jgi:hypothetical protein
MVIALCFSACGDGDEGKGNAVSTGGSTTGGSATTTGGSATATGGSATGGSRAGSTATGGSPASESAGAGGQLETNAGASTAGAGGTDDAPSSAGGVGGTIGVAGGGGGDCLALGPADGLVLDGDAVIASQADVEFLREFSGITGNLELAVTLEPLDVALPQLRHVGGDLRAESTRLRRFAAPRLEGIDGELWFYLNYELVAVDLRNLTQVETRVFIHRNRELSVLQLDALVSVGDIGVEVNANLALPDCFLDIIGERFTFVRTTAPECRCTRSCGLIEAVCP